jgi:phosphatidylglycerol---prolipoprotein diacylglyceryl transferase
MYPELFSIKIGSLDHTVFSYEFFLWLAILATIGTSITCIYRRKLPLARHVVLLAMVLAASMVGARVYYSLTKVNGFSEIFDFQMKNFSIFGGLIGALLVAGIFGRVFYIDVWALSDMIIPALSIGIITARIGCLLNGCCFGTECNVPWGMVYPKFSTVHIYQFANGKISFLTDDAVPVHPTQIYEIAFILFSLLVISLIRKRKPKDGILFLVFLSMYSCFRIFNSIFRETAPDQAVSQASYNLQYFALMLVCLALVWVKITGISGTDQE